MFDASLNDSTAFWSTSFVKTVIYAAWRRPDDDSEFCEQIELYLPEPPPPPEPLPERPVGVWLGDKRLGDLDCVRSGVLRIVSGPFRRISLYHVQKNPTHLLTDRAILQILLLKRQWDQSSKIIHRPRISVAN